MFKETDRAKCEQLFDKYYKGRKFSRTQYRDAVRQHACPGDHVLDAGCGRYLEFAQELPEAVEVVGIDLEPELQTRNEASPYGIRADLECLPFPAAQFDLVISRSVIEHLHHPARVFREFHRILKPGGKVILSTPNKYDYVSVIAALTPYSWHRRLASKTLQVNEDDVFPTLYRANTLSALRKQLTSAGFEQIRLEAINHYPVYLMFSPILFRLGTLYERVTSMEALRSLRGTLLCVFQKPHGGAIADTCAKASGKAAGVSSVAGN
jgi:ubiquinone/menaquinone biosynthesis C-methylase UbiE